MMHRERKNKLMNRRLKSEIEMIRMRMKEQREGET